MPPRGHRTVAVDLDASAQSQPKPLNWPWYVVASLGPILVLLAGWLVLAALTSVGWLTSPDAEFPSALRLAAEVLVLAHGAPVTIAGQQVSIAPLGLSMGLVFLALPAAQLAAREAATQVGTSDDTGKIWADPEAVVYRSGGTFAAVYAVATLILAGAVGAPSLRALLGGAVIGGIAGLWGACRGVDYDPTESWPAWLRAVPRAMLASGLFLIAAGAAALAWALWDGRARVSAITASLDGGIPALVLLIAIHLAYVPNVVLACCAWILGAGVSVGDDSLITVTMTDVGVQPAIPMLGIVPEPGPAPSVTLWWFAAAAAAGVVAALVVTLARPRARFDETAITGALSGVLAGLLMVVLCSLGGGSLGTGRLSWVGARVPQLAVFAPTILGLSGLTAGLLLGLLRWPRRSAPPIAEAN